MELAFPTSAGTVHGMAELLATKQESPSGCLQPFRFVALDDENHVTLHKALESLLYQTIVVPGPAKRAPRRNGTTLSEDHRKQLAARSHSFTVLVQWRQAPSSIGVSPHEKSLAHYRRMKARTSQSNEASGTDIQFHTTLPLAVLSAECEYKQSVRTGWRAYDPVAPHHAVGFNHRRSAA